MLFQSELRSCFFCLFIVYGSGGMKNLPKIFSERRSADNKFKFKIHFDIFRTWIGVIRLLKPVIYKEN